MQNDDWTRLSAKYCIGGSTCKLQNKVLDHNIKTAELLTASACDDYVWVCIVWSFALCKWLFATVRQVFYCQIVRLVDRWKWVISAQQLQVMISRCVLDAMGRCHGCYPQSSRIPPGLWWCHFLLPGSRQHDPWYTGHQSLGSRTDGPHEFCVQNLRCWNSLPAQSASPHDDLPWPTKRSKILP